MLLCVCLLVLCGCCSFLVVGGCVLGDGWD